MKKTLILILLSIVLLNPSCSVEKRVHRKGYHVEWFAKKATPASEVTNNSTTKIAPVLPSRQKGPAQEASPSRGSLSASASEIVPLPLKGKVFAGRLIVSAENDCDIIILKNGDEIQAKVLEIGQSEVKYKLCDNQDGPTFVKGTDLIFMIKHPNGTRTVMESSPGNTGNMRDNSPDIGSNVTPASSQGRNKTDKLLLVAVILWFLFGLIGVHRFYLGHIGIGILYLLTFGVCGIGWLVDGILFLTGDLKPKDGEYDDSDTFP